MYGSQWGSCDVDGSYAITNLSSGEILAEVIAESADYGDQETNNFCVSSPCPWTVVTNITEEDCYGDDNGIIDVSVSDTTGVFSYDMGLGAQSSGTFYDLAQGSYSIEISDSNCSSITNVVLSGPESVSGIITVNDISCNGGLNDGSISIEPSGGVGDYSFDFGSGYTENGYLNNLEQGVYSISVQDSNGCKGNLTATVGEPSEISINYNALAESFGNDGEIDVTAYGGQPPYSFTWTGPQDFSSSSEDLQNLISGIYQVTVIDDNGCESDEFEVNVDSHLGVNENYLDAFNVFPNPSNGEFLITFKNAVKEKIDIRVFGLAGRVLYFSSVKGMKDVKMNLIHINNGVYFLEIISIFLYNMEINIDYLKTIFPENENLGFIQSDEEGLFSVSSKNVSKFIC